MCTYQTEQIKVTGSGKGANGWFGVTDASVYYDHPVHAPAEHSLNIDFLNPGQGPAARLAVELTAESARALAQAIEAALSAAPADLLTGPAPRAGRLRPRLARPGPPRSGHLTTRG